MMRGQSTKPDETAIDRAQPTAREEVLARVAATIPPELAVAIAQGSAESIAAFILEHPRLRDPVLVVVQRQRGNAFAQAVVGSVTTVHKQPVNHPSEPTPEAKAEPAPALPATPSAPRDAASQRMVDRRKTAGWEQVARGGINDDRNAPSEIRLPASVVTAIEQAWQDSLAQDTEREEGGNLVRTYGGSYNLRRTSGYSTDAFEPDPHDVGWTETMFGTVHTHPYRDEHARNPASMPTDYGTVSAPDLDSIVNGDGPLFIVRSGANTYVIAKSKPFNQLVERHQQQGTLGELVMEMENVSNKIFEATKGNMAQKLEQAIIAVCNAYHLVYYEGQGSDLKRVGGPS